VTGEKPDPRVERIALAIYEARVHTTVIHGWSSEPEALRERFRKAATVALAAADAVSPGEDRYRKALVRARGAVAALRSALECGETYSGTLRSEVEKAQHEIVEARSGSQPPEEAEGWKAYPISEEDARGLLRRRTR
jgi:hypothetical protein